MTKKAAAAMLAAWRRQGHGVWYITIIIEGHDDVFDMLYPGSFDSGYASKMACSDIATEHDTALRYVHVSKIELRDLP